MAELVEFNLEQNLPFFNGLKNHIEDEKLKDLVRKRRHFEYKICSKNREYKEFEFFLKHELDVLDFLNTLKIPEIKNLISYQMNLIERIIKQMTIHFQSQPKVFLVAAKVMRRMKRTTSEKYYWEELLNKHGVKNKKFYIAAGISTMHNILETLNAKNSRKTSSKVKLLNQKLEQAKKINSVMKINKYEKEINNLVSEQNKIKQENYITHMNWTRKRFLDGFSEFPKDKLLFKEYLKFEILNRDFFLNATEELTEDIVPVREGLLLDYLLNKSQEYFDDPKFLQEILNVVKNYAPNYESDILDNIMEILKKAPSSFPHDFSNQPEQMEVEQVDEFESFKKQYPDLKMIRIKSPAVVEKEFHKFLQTLKQKMINSQINKQEQIGSLRNAIEWILNDTEWGSNSLDIWWDYYEIEKSCGDVLKACMILQNASRHLRPDLKPKLNLRKLKENKFQ